MKIGKEGIKLVILFQEKLGISLSEAVIILLKNKTAQSLLKEELALSITGTNKNLSALMGITVQREFYDFELIRPDEIELIRQYYDIEIGKDNFLTTSGIKRVSKCEINKNIEELVKLYVDKFLRRERIYNLISKNSSVGEDTTKRGFLKAANSSRIKTVINKENICKMKEDYLDK